MKKILGFAGRNKTLLYFRQVAQIQQEGGQPNEQFKGFKTPGGVFFSLVKKDNELNPEQIKILFKESKKQKRNENYIKYKMGSLLDGKL